MRTIAGLLVAHLLFSGGAPAQSVLFRDGFEAPCTDEDVDQDRLSSCEEARAATDPLRADSDGDGLRDGDEVLGTLGGLNLPAMGVDPRRKDLLIELDWSDDAIDCAPHSHRPSAHIVERIKAFFARAPVANVDGSMGINLIVDVGQGGVFTGGNFVAIPDGASGQLYEPYGSIKAANFAGNRSGYFRYQLHVHRTSTDPTRDYGGIAQLPGDDSVVAMHCNTYRPDIEFVILHELGHNLGLNHGGNDGCAIKPNYNSIMNYRFAGGLDHDCDSLPNSFSEDFAFSNGSRITLDPQAVREQDGVCAPDHPAHQPIDWNCNGVIDPGSVVDPLLSCDSHSVSDHNDYAALQIPPLRPQASAAGKIGRDNNDAAVTVILDAFPESIAPSSKAESAGWPCPHPSPEP